MFNSNIEIYKLSCILVLFVSCSILGSVKYLTKRTILNHHLTYQNDFLKQDSIQSNFSLNNNSICKHHTINEFPHDFIPFKEFKYSRLIIHTLIIIYLLYGVSIVCDEFFVESLNKISHDLGLKEDVAGATFMAAGTSAPELFTSIIGVIFANSDIGTGTIVGSAIFNVLFIISVCALAAKTVLNIDFYPISRDCIFYGICVLSLYIVLYDGYIHWYESVFLLIEYAFYILIMYFNNSIEKWTKNKVNEMFKTEKNSSEIKQTTLVFVINDNPLLDENVNIITKKNEKKDNKSDKFNPCDIPDKSMSRIEWILVLPINLLFYITIPDPKRKIFSKFPFYFVTFLISTIYIGVFTYGVVWMVVIISFNINIPDTVAGLTVLAAGTSLPEVASSIIITRKGKGKMAISNSIGSNVFDILICLGLPWFIQGIIINPDVTIKIYSGGMAYSTLLLLSSIFLLLICFFANKWNLDKRFGIIMLLIWIIITVITCLVEYDVFGKFSIPSCD